MCEGRGTSKHCFCPCDWVRMCEDRCTSTLLLLPEGTSTVSTAPTGLAVSSMCSCDWVRAVDTALVASGNRSNVEVHWSSPWTQEVEKLPLEVLEGIAFLPTGPVPWNQLWDWRETCWTLSGLHLSGRTGSSVAMFGSLPKCWWPNYSKDATSDAKTPMGMCRTGLGDHSNLPDSCDS